MDLTLGDSNNLRQWFPLSEEGDALAMVVALTNVTKEFSEDHIKVLKPRLMEGKTLEESAQVEGKTRERVRQIESSFHYNERIHDRKIEIDLQESNDSNGTVRRRRARSESPVEKYRITLTAGIRNLIDQRLECAIVRRKI